MDKDVRARRKVVFLPYKASMWDSMESVWMAAKADLECDAYVISIPYYDRNPDGSFRQEYYEGELYPEYVDITRYDEFDFAEHRPDVIFIHNPYDNANSVTSVHPFFYSENLKRFTNSLVYIPYFCTSGGMGEGWRSCSAYYHVDYFIIQAEKYRKYYDSTLPQEKLLPLGSPKFDKVIRTCNDLVEPPYEWKRIMGGKKVFFYNTSLTGMLENTPAFLKKMEYVFKCFMNRNDVCLLWRPHPLMEATFESMRALYKPIYDGLKSVFITHNLGIYDDTPDIVNSIALSDAYIGDAGTSITSLFGVAGKPVFVLDNIINAGPDNDDWRGSFIRPWHIYGDVQWMVTAGNQLYHYSGKARQWQFFCDLSQYNGGSYYSHIVDICGKKYVCPMNAQDILQLGENGIERKIDLERLTEQQGAFYGGISSGKYLFLIPNSYPRIVRYDVTTNEVSYLTEYPKIFIGEVNGKVRYGGYCIQDEYLFISSPVDSQVLVIHMETMDVQLLVLNTSYNSGCETLAADGGELWFLANVGAFVAKWNIKTGEVREYNLEMPGLKCKHPLYGYEFNEKPFGFPAFYGEYVYFPPCYGNMFLRLNKKTGEVLEWKLPLSLPEKVRSSYYAPDVKCYFVRWVEDFDSPERYLFSDFDKRVYCVNLESGECREIDLPFEFDEIKEREAGFGVFSEWQQYVCVENAFNSLSAFLDGKITGHLFDLSRHKEAFGSIAENCDGTCGQKIYRYVCEHSVEE